MAPRWIRMDSLGTPALHGEFGLLNVGAHTVALPYPESTGQERALVDCGLPRNSIHEEQHGDHSMQSGMVKAQLLHASASTVTSGSSGSLYKVYLLESHTPKASMHQLIVRKSPPSHDSRARIAGTHTTRARTRRAKCEHIRASK